MPIEFDDYFLDFYVFDNKGRVLTHEACTKMKDYCAVFPRRCYLESDFLEKYIKTCIIISKTALFMDNLYNGVKNTSTPWTSGAGIANLKKTSINKTIEKWIPKSQMPIEAKHMLIDIIMMIPELTGGTYIDFRGHHVTNITFYNFIGIIKANRPLFEEIIQMWREKMATSNFKKPIQIEYIIRRFIKALTL